MSDTTIVMHNLKVGFQKQIVCEIESAEVQRAQITVLCGPNGAGKSTLLKTIAKQIPAIEGTVSISGVALNELTELQLAKQLAFVPQFVETRRSLSVHEWVSLGRNPHQHWWSWEWTSEDKKKVDESLERTNCLSLKNKLIDELSGGERQRVLIATALAQEPDYMLLDEPTAHLDFRHQLELMDLLKQLKGEGLGILLVLHDLTLTARIADDVMLLQKNSGSTGTLKAKGEVNAVLSQESLRQVYGVDMEIVSTADGELTSYVATKVAKADG